MNNKIILYIFCVIFVSQNAFAYVGPGSGLSAIGAFLALVAGIIIAIIGFLWYPIKRMIKGKSKEPTEEEKETE